jgi:hypothetical protein
MWEYFLTTMSLILGFVVLIKEIYFKDKIPKRMSYLIAILIIANTIPQYYLIYQNDLEKKYSLYSGILRGDEQINYPIIKMGEVRFVSNSPELIWNIIPNMDPIIIWLQDGKLMLSTIIRDKNGDVISKIDSNQWTINPNLIFDRNFDKTAIEVVDKQDRVIFQAILEDDGVSISFISYTSDGWVYAVGPVPGGAIIEKRDDINEIEYKIERIFMYPSKLHPGERKNN